MTLACSEIISILLITIPENEVVIFLFPWVCVLLWTCTCAEDYVNYIVRLSWRMNLLYFVSVCVLIWPCTCAVPEVKRRKRHRRKHFENQEPCIMRGVYFKNMKWQAAIKVEKKQIHLGTVGSQEEAARLYDRYYYCLY